MGLKNNLFGNIINYDQNCLVYFRSNINDFVSRLI